MADGELKKKCSNVQGVFNRWGNAIDFNTDVSSEHDLKLELSALKSSCEEIFNSSLLIAVLLFQSSNLEEEDTSGFEKDITDVKKRLQDSRKVSGH